MICKRCGIEFDPRRYRRSDGSTQCPECRTIYRRNPQQRSTDRSHPTMNQNRSAGNRAQKKDVPFFRKKLWKLPIWAWGAILIILIAIGSGSNTERNATIQNAAAPANVEQSTDTSNGETVTEPSSRSIALSADFGSSKIEAVQASIRTVGSSTYVVCEYKWTNNSDQNEMFLTAISEKAFQNGVALDTGYILGLDTNMLTEVMPGYSLTIYSVYTLTDPTAEITFTVEPFLDLFDEYTPLTFIVDPI